MRPTTIDGMGPDELWEHEQGKEQKFCIMSGCDFEACEERESPVTGDTIDLCYQCSAAYDMGLEHGMVAAEQAS